MNKLIKITLILVAVCTLGACKKFLDITPDNVATIDYAFRLRSTAERYLFSCYNYMPALGAFDSNVANAAGDEFWLPVNHGSNAWKIARGGQSKANSYMNYWQGNNGGKDLYQGIRECNIFLDNINKVPDLADFEKARWEAEVKFLKAYYHYYIFRMYGPVPIIKVNVPVDASIEEVYPARAPIDSCVNYMVQLLDEAIPNLPERIDNEVSELGRITRAIAMSIKAEILVTAASPLFNGNPDYAGFKDPEGTLLFSQSFDPKKWERARDAAKEAVEFSESLGHKLYVFNPAFFQYKISDTIKIQMNIRNALAEKWNPEIIWGNTNSMVGSLQNQSTPRGLDPARVSNSTTNGNIAPPLKIAEMFYSSNGVPIREDKSFDYAGRFKLRSVTAPYKRYLQEGYVTASLNFDREPRFYADLGFDGGVWYGQGLFDDAKNMLFVSAKKGQPATAQNESSYSVTGYWPKKLVNFNNVIGETTYTVQTYPWPMIRLANMYLLYAEAENEVSGPNSVVYNYVNQVRARAGLFSVQDSWSNYSNNPTKYTTQIGMREILHQERLIELAFEGQRFWDLRRWKKAGEELNKPITGWDLIQEDAASYYRERVIYNQTFTARDYLWPLPESELLSNKRINQNPGW
ncbi:RagB/SusD family nutrient uptake outer membrane protein [Pedobacter psychroterrae]|uniref:RagB/SusD family nutrient uptake outer membrane protein n=1 Tax=Pedobacter psychroterrae TaxID=2530453 RepID=A0A4R0NK05_9SPHI|nr:RagB/SusD family nutrient uptake outer membrane protein [Pedobacter psychroterrae]TCD00168.1 RagB/SusD family nutrient uptake outer membrane protein [Pedobacter psychroterrae]